MAQGAHLIPLCLAVLWTHFDLNKNSRNYILKHTLFKINTSEEVKQSWTGWGQVGPHHSQLCRGGQDPLGAAEQVVSVGTLRDVAHSTGKQV